MHQHRSLWREGGKEICNKNQIQIDIRERERKTKTKIDYGFVLLSKKFVSKKWHKRKWPSHGTLVKLTFKYGIFKIVLSLKTI